MYVESLAGSQITSIDPGNVPDGVFWTIAIPSDSVEIDLEDATAEYTLKRVHTLDFGTFENDLAHGPATPVTLSFKVRWSGKKRKFQLQDAATGFRGNFMDTGATVEFSGREPEGTLIKSFVSDAASTSTTVSAVLGQERNGVFFKLEGKNDEHGG